MKVTTHWNPAPGWFEQVPPLAQGAPTHLSKINQPSKAFINHHDHHDLHHKHKHHIAPHYLHTRQYLDRRRALWDPEDTDTDEHQRGRHTPGTQGKSRPRSCQCSPGERKIRENASIKDFPKHTKTITNVYNSWTRICAWHIKNRLSAVLNKFEKIFPTHCLPLQPRLCLLRGSSGLACNSIVAFYKQCTTWTHHWHFTMYIQRMCNIFSIWQHCSFPIAFWPFASNLKDIINIMAPSEGKCSK